MQPRGVRHDVRDCGNPERDAANARAIAPPPREVGGQLGPVLAPEGRRIEVQQRAIGPHHARSAREALLAREPDEPFDAPELGARDGFAERRHPVVAAALVVQVGRGPLARLEDQPLLQHALDGSVERARAEPQLAARAGFDVLDDGVAVAILLRDGEQDVKRGGRQRQQCRDLVGVMTHATNYIRCG